LFVWSPGKVKVSPSKFEVAGADRVRREWFCYGRSKIPQNLYFEEFVNTNDGIVATTSADWFKPEFKTNSRKPAVEIL